MRVQFGHPGEQPPDVPDRLGLGVQRTEQVGREEASTAAAAPAAPIARRGLVSGGGREAALQPAEAAAANGIRPRRAPWERSRQIPSVCTV